MEHGLAYEAMEAGEVDLIDAYSTDGKLRRCRGRVNLGAPRLQHRRLS